MTEVQARGGAGLGQAGTAMDSYVSVYCDTGLIASVVLGPNDPFFSAAIHFFDDAKLKGVLLVISALTLLEAADVVVKRTKAAIRCTDESGREREMVDAKAAAAVERLYSFVNELVVSKRAEILEDEVEAKLDIDDLRKKMLEHMGRTPQARKGATYRHEGIGPIDWIHIALAYLAGARAICTTDKAMVQIGGDAKYGGIRVIVLHSRQKAG